MKKLNLLKLSLAAVLLSSPVMVNAQQPNMLSYPGNFYADYVGVRLTASSTSGYTKNLAYTITNDGTGATGEWGAAITNQLVLDVQKADPYEACGTLADLSGKLALIKRGNCEFGTKSLNAQNANAAAVIIVNNVGGGPVGMAAGADGAGVNIPVLMISQDDGDAIEAELSNGETVTITITTWSNNETHDLGIVNSGISMWHNYAIPSHQMVDASNHVPYKGIDGVVIANFGASTETGVKLATRVTFTPEGGSTEVVREDTSDAIASFAPADSIRSLFIDENYDLKNSKEVGRYDITYEVFADDTDGFPDDNKASYSFYTTPKVFSKGRYDFQNGKPIVPISFGYTATSGVAEYLRGPVYYNAEGGYRIEAVQVSVSTGSATNNDLSTLGGDLSVLIWKWVDGSKGQPADSLFQAGEAELIGEGSYAFRGAPQDTSGNVFTLDIIDISGNPVITEDDTWYWVTASLPVSAYLGADGVLNYYVRSFDRYHSSEPFVEPYSVAFRDNPRALQDAGNAGIVVDMWPSRRTTNNVDSVSFTQEKRGILPALPMIVSQFPVSVDEVKAVSGNAGLKIYPNPASSQISVNPGFTESGHISFKVIDVAGKLVKVERLEYVKDMPYTISTEDLAPGSYYLITNVNSQSAFGKFTIVK